MLPSVSIGLPVYNGEDYLERSIQSLLAQTREDFELIISDNHSSDRTPEICARYAGIDPRIRFLRNDKNLGAAENYNRVFRESSGRYFKWASHDDLCAPEFLERCVEVLEGDPSVVLCFPRTSFIGGDGEMLGLYEENDDFADERPSARFRTWLFGRSGPWCNSVFGVIRSDVLRETPLIGKYNSSDVILLGELLLRGRVVRIEDVLFFRRDHAGRSVRANPDEESRAAWFEPSSAGKTHMTVWRWLRGYASAVWRAPMGAGEKARCGTLLAKWTVSHRGRLRDELVRACGRTVGWTRSSAI